MLVRLKGRFAAARSRRLSYTGSRTQPTSLLRLPQELLETIVSFLDISEAVCLSICSKDLYRKLGVDRWQLLRLGQGHEDHRKELLAHLARDDPKLFICHICSYLHLVARVEPAHNRTLLQPCIKSLSVREMPIQLFEIYGGLSGYQLIFPHVQLVMARHRNGPDHGIPISSLAATEIRRSERYKVLQLLNVEPRIIGDELFLRIQHWITFDQDDPATFERLRCPSICSHINKFPVTYTGPATFNLLQCQIQHVGERVSCPTCNALYRCFNCSVEFESDAIRLESRRLAVIITKWLSVGNGDSPADPNWRRHLRSWSGSQPIATKKDWYGSKRIFEHHIERSQETTTRQNASLLRGSSSRKKLHQVVQDVWRHTIGPIDAKDRAM